MGTVRLPQEPMFISKCTRSANKLKGREVEVLGVCPIAGVHFELEGISYYIRPWEETLERFTPQFSVPPLGVVVKVLGKDKYLIANVKGRGVQTLDVNDLDLKKHSSTSLGHS